VTSYETLAKAVGGVGEVPCMSQPELFFTDDDSAVALSRATENTRQAVSLCRGCPVRLLCLDYALSNNEIYGVWGGTSAKQRGGMRRGRNT
jgi:hypothetical protein